MLQSTTSTAAVTRDKIPPRHSKRPRNRHERRRVEAVGEAVGGNDGVVLVTRSKRARRRSKRAPTPHAPRRGKAFAERGEPGDDGAVLVTFIEAERLLRLSRMTLHKMIAAGTLRVRRFGRAVRIPMSEVRRLGTPGVTPTK